MAAVERRALLGLLQRGAVAAGVDVRFSTPVEVDEIMAAGYDLVVAADGANSRLRVLAYSDVDCMRRVGPNGARPAPATGFRSA